MLAQLSAIVALIHAPAAGIPPAEPVRFVVRPAAVGKQLVRVSLPFPKGLVASGKPLVVKTGGQAITVGFRELTCYPPDQKGARFVRRGMVTFPYTFKTLSPVEFTAAPGSGPAAKGKLPVSVKVSGQNVNITYGQRPHFEASLIAPPRTSKTPARVETVESNAYYLWQRYHLDDPQWPRIIEVRADALGGVVVVAHLQRNLPEDDYAPDLGWAINTYSAAVLKESGKQTSLSAKVLEHEFTNEIPCALVLKGSGQTLYHPDAAIKRKGHVEVGLDGDQVVYKYYRCTASDNVPMQQASWQRAEFAIAPKGVAPVTVTLESPHAVTVDWKVWDQLYSTGKPLEFPAQPELAVILKYHHDAIVRSIAHGDDWGNVTGYSDSSQTGGVMGMNRLNHCPAMFEEGYRSGDVRLVQTGVLWCDNMYDQSIWWGPEKTGGTRYNNAQRSGGKANVLLDDKSYMWRSDSSVHFCTKGYDSFLIAYEETGDPRMKEALDAQVKYAAEYVHADQGECRNIGDVRDFIRLYEYTGEKHYLDEALRLFREVRNKLSTGDLFDQGGRPIEANLPFIENDGDGMAHGYAKPYIIGYGLAGVPELGRYYPNEPKLRDMVKAVSDFLVNSQDPLGGWRYPHPRSSGLILSQGIEHAWQIVQADKMLGPDEKHLDAIERVLRQRILGWQKTGRMFGGLSGWEAATGKLKPGQEMHDLYAHPEDRDYTKDYTDGIPGFGGGAPEAVVYFPEVLAYYLQHRPASRLLEAPKPDEPLGIVLSRVAGSLPVSDPKQVPGSGIRDKLPVFADRVAGRLTFPLSWLSGSYKDFNAWKKTARAKVMECLLAAPPAADFDPKLIAEEDRGTYTARKIELSITGDSRASAYMLVPKGKGPFPAVLLLHDHGARFDIGKEKVVRPFDCSKETLESAEQWVSDSYGGRFIGDELAKRGYVCIVTDALNWGDRGGAGYDNQQALASNLLQLGMSLSGLIAHEDLRMAEFLATRPEVDPKHVAAMGLSMGSFRTWQVAALSDRITAGVAICWMATVKGLMVPGNNQTKGQSSYTMIHPGIFNYLDYPDVASIACPKPMLFYNGLQDGLFPVPSVKDAYQKLRQVWDSQGAGKSLETRLWDVPHCFNKEMQDAAFTWLDKVMGKSNGQ